MTLQEQEQISSTTTTTSEIELGLKFILSHFEQPVIFPRTIMTKKLGYQIIVYSEEETLARFKQYNFVDCRISAFPSLKEGVKWIPELLFIDLDRNNFETEIGFESALTTTLRNIKNELGYRAIPTVLKTGGGYHIYQPVSCPKPLESIPEFKEFDRPSEQFLRFAKHYLSNRKADPNNNPSFKSCLLRIPGSINSKYNNKVTIVQKWNGFRPRLSLETMLGFKRFLKQKKRDQENQRQKIILHNMKDRSNISSNNSYISWIEHLLQTPIEDFRKLIIDLVIAPYLINIRKLSYSDSYKIIREWLDKCNELERLDNYRNFVNCRINYAIRNAMNKGIPPMSKDKIKTDAVYSELFQILKKERVL